MGKFRKNKSYRANFLIATIMDGVINDKVNWISTTALIQRLALSKRFAIGVIAGIFMMIFAPNILTNTHRFITEVKQFKDADKDDNKECKAGKVEINNENDSGIGKNDTQPEKTSKSIVYIESIPKSEDAKILPNDCE